MPCLVTVSVKTLNGSKTTDKNIQNSPWLEWNGPEVHNNNNNNNNNNTSICKAHNVSIRAESEAPTLVVIWITLYQVMPVFQLGCGRVIPLNTGCALPTHTHTHSVLTAIFPGKPGLASCPLNSPSPFIPRLRILCIMTDTNAISSVTSYVYVAAMNDQVFNCILSFGVQYRLCRCLNVSYTSGQYVTQPAATFKASTISLRRSSSSFCRNILLTVSQTLPVASLLLIFEH